MHWRKSQPALCAGDIQFIDTPEPVLAFTRTHAGETLFVALNLGAQDVTIPVPPSLRLQQIACPGPRSGRVEGASLQLPAYAAIYATVAA